MILAPDLSNDGWTPRIHSHHSEQQVVTQSLGPSLLYHGLALSLTHHLRLLPATTRPACEDRDPMAHRAENIQNVALREKVCLPLIQNKPPQGIL